MSTFSRWFWLKVWGGGLLIGFAAEFSALWAGLGLVRASFIAFGVLWLYDCAVVFGERRRRLRRRRPMTGPEVGHDEGIDTRH